MAIFEIHIHSDVDKLDRIIKLLTRMEKTMATQADVDAITQQVQKIGTEVTNAADAFRAQIEELQRQIDEGNANSIDLTGLRAALDQLDAINPDAPVDNGDSV